MAEGRSRGMVLLRTEDGRTYVELDAVNARIAPTRVDAVPVPARLAGLLVKPELDANEMAELLIRADGRLEFERTAAGWPPPIAQVFFPGMPPELHRMLTGFGSPHTNPADEVHHVVDGAVTFGLVLPGGAQALIVIQPGDALRLHAGTEHWSRLTDDHRVKAILYLSQPPGYAHSYTGTEIRIS